MKEIPLVYGGQRPFAVFRTGGVISVADGFSLRAPASINPAELRSLLRVSATSRPPKPKLESMGYIKIRISAHILDFLA